MEIFKLKVGGIYLVIERVKEVDEATKTVLGCVGYKSIGKTTDYYITKEYAYSDPHGDGGNHEIAKAVEDFLLKEKLNNFIKE